MHWIFEVRSSILWVGFEYIIKYSRKLAYLGRVNGLGQTKIYEGNYFRYSWIICSTSRVIDGKAKFLVELCRIKERPI